MYPRSQPLSGWGGARNGKARDLCECGRTKVKTRALCRGCAEEERAELIRQRSDPNYDTRPRSTMMLFCCGRWWKV